MPEVLPRRLLKGWETPHVGGSVKACQINGDLSSISLSQKHRWSHVSVESKFAARGVFPAAGTSVHTEWGAQLTAQL